jgi:hypothetical protein
VIRLSPQEFAAISQPVMQVRATAIAAGGRTSNESPREEAGMTPQADESAGDENRRAESVTSVEARSEIKTGKREVEPLIKRWAKSLGGFWK